MALLFMDGFDHYATADGLKKWNVFGTGVTINSSGGRRSGGCLNFSNNTRFVDKTLPSSYATLIAGFAYDASAGNTADIMCFLDGATIHAGLHLNANNAIVAFRATNATVLGTSANGVVPASGFCHIEVKILVSDTVGTVDVKVNGASVLSLTGQDTRNAGNASMTGFRIRSTGVNCKVDDLCVCDTSGSTNNTFLGDVRIDTNYPTSDGNYTQFTCSSGSSHFALVDEATPNTTDYNDGAAVNDRDSYGMGNLTALTSQTVYGVQVNTAILKDDAGAKSAATFVRSSSTNGDGASTALGTSQTYISQVFETDPNGSIAWTESSVNAMEAGVKVTA
jgi:hypothetical protein